MGSGGSEKAGRVPLRRKTKMAVALQEKTREVHPPKG